VCRTLINRGNDEDKIGFWTAFGVGGILCF
jgi:hypothetical protein